MQTRSQHEEAKAFAKLFAGMTKSFITKDKENNYLTHDKELTLEDYQDHINGKVSIGVEPRNDSSKCRFAMLDFDGHKSNKKDVRPFTKGQIKKIIDKINFLGLPLSVFKSNTGGLHAYIFFDDWYPAKDVRHILKKFSYALGYERESLEVEIFPKTDVLDNEGKKINLPYKGGNSRVLLNSDAQEQTFAEFLKLAPDGVTNLHYVDKFKLLDHGKPQHRNDRTFAATAFFKKHYDDWEQKVKDYNQLFNDPPLGEAPKDSPNRLDNTVLKSNEKKDYFDAELEEAPPTELVGYDISEYRVRTDITRPKFLVGDLMIEGSTNFTFGEKGKGKTEKVLGLINALSRGEDFMQFGITEAHPCAFFDFEMHPFDTIARNEPYLKKYGGDPKKDYLHIIHWNDQKNRNFPDIASKEGQNLILKYLQKMEAATGKKPFCVLDNLRSASGYKENDADSWRPIGLWLKHLTHGLNYTLDVVDHSGKNVEMEMRGTSSKADWANVCLQVLPEKRQGGLMRIKVKYAKARGLRPDQTDDFVCQYDFAGNWTLGASDKEQEDEALKEELKKLLPKKLTQEKMAKKLKISAGKVNKLLKEIEKEKM